MQNFLDTLRLYDFGIYYKLYYFGIDHQAFGTIFLLLTRLGIVFFFFSFIYLIWKKRILAFLCALLAMGVAGAVDLLVFVFWRRPLPFVSHTGIVNPNSSGMLVDATSFPSSHTYIAFGIATSVFLYGHKKLGGTLFLLALVIAISQIGSGLHYPSDVLAGMVLGIISGVLVYWMIQKLDIKERIEQ